MRKNNLPNWLRWQFIGYDAETGANKYYERDWIQIVLILLVIGLGIAAAVFVVALGGWYGR